MTVYVDDAFIPYRGMLMSHMIADTRQELLDMADKIGLKREWLQREGNYGEHFDISKGKRRAAIQHGAQVVTPRELAEMCVERRGPEGQAAYLGEPT